MKNIISRYVRWFHQLYFNEQITGAQITEAFIVTIILLMFLPLWLPIVIIIAILYIPIMILLTIFNKLVGY